MTPAQRSTAQRLASHGFVQTRTTGEFKRIRGTQLQTLYMHPTGLIALDVVVGKRRVERSASRLFYAPRTLADMERMLEWFDSPQWKQINPKDGSITHDPNAKHSIRLLTESQKGS